MSVPRRRLTAWIALFAMLFSAVSPAIAAALFRDRADILGRMLAIPAVVEHGPPPQAVLAEHDGCPHESAADAGREQLSHSAHHGNTGHESHDGSEHAAHGTFCSFCLSPGSTVTLPASTAAASEVTAAIDSFIPAGHEQRPAGVHASARHPRDPPAILI